MQATSSALAPNSTDKDDNVLFSRFKHHAMPFDEEDNAPLANPCRSCSPSSYTSSSVEDSDTDPDFKHQ